MFYVDAKVYLSMFTTINHQLQNSKYDPTTKFDCFYGDFSFGIQTNFKFLTSYCLGYLLEKGFAEVLIHLYYFYESSH